MSKQNPKDMNRRQFLQAGTALVGGVTLFGAQPLIRARDNETGAARWALLSDTHVPADPENNYRGFYPYRNLQEIVPQIAGNMPEGVIVTGDLARLEGLPGDYTNARHLLSPIWGTRPICVGLGNHDHRANFQAAFAGAVDGKQTISGKQVVVMDAGPVRLVVLDSLLYVNKTAGLLGRAQRNWLADFVVKQGDKPMVLFFHHTLSDGDGDLLDAPRLFDIIKPASAVKALVFGHSHTYHFREVEGLHLINLPASGYNFRDDQPIGWVETQMTADGARFQLHATGGNTGIDGQVTELRWRA